ncbi:PAS domain-containing sensor histidine kinase [Lunatibacter salilacus]|uniref:PAS domain-containing sensor histidine kinase n=1 Tax=Lunatibacter salilacus TaxID=2483804 RepID=UPI00131DD83F|nr:PAS domain-containing sensor histidine kinase [Lunatibacter salilacus]
MPLKQGLSAVSNNKVTQTQKDNACYKSIVENNSFFIVKTDLQGNYTYMNPYFCEIHNIITGDYLGKESLSLIVPEDHVSCIETVQKCFAEPNVSHWVNLKKPCPNGELSTRWEFKLIKDPNGNPIEILCVGHDITPLILKQEELQNLVDITSKQNQRLKNFAYIISHNIRSHVANIIGILEAEDLMKNVEESKLAWSILKESAISLDDTLHNLNDIVSIQSSTNLPFRPISVYREINRVVRSIQVIVDQGESTINYNFGNEEIVKSNPAYFESIVLNLLTNSLKYKCPSRPLVIDIGLEKQGKYRLLDFKDNGVGINLEKHKEDVFGMYKRFHSNIDGRGLGLFIMKTQIEAMNGKIEVESEVGVSTTFKLYFPEK